MENINDINKEILNLRRQLADTRNLLILKEEECTNLNVKNDFGNTKISKLEREKETISTELKKVQAEIDILKSNFDTDVLKLEELYVQNEQLKSEIASLHEKYQRENALNTQSVSQTLKKNIADLEKSLSIQKNELVNKYQSEISAYQTKVYSLEKALGESIDAIHAEYKLRIDNITRQHASEIESLKESKEQELIQLKLDKENHEGIIKSQFQNIIEKLEVQLEKKEHDINTQHVAKIKEYEKTTESLSQKISALETSLEQTKNTYEDSLSAKEKEINQLKDTLTAHTETIATLEETIETENLHSSSFHAEQSLLQSQIDLLLSENQKLKAELDTIATHHSFAKELTEDSSILNTQIIELTQRIETLASENSALQNNITSLEAMLSEANSTLNKKEVELSSLTQEHQHVAAEKTSYFTDLQKFLSDNSALSSKVSETTSALQHTEQKIEELTAKLIAAETNGQTKHTEYEELAVINAELEKQITEQQSTIETLKSEIETYKIQTQKTYQELSSEYELLIKENDLLQFNLESVTPQIKLLEEEIIDIQNKQSERINELKSVIEETNKKASEYESKLTYIQKEFLSVINENDQLIDLLQKTMSEIKSIYVSENQKIDISYLDNHRKNTIIANQNSLQPEKLKVVVDGINLQLESLLNEKLN